MIIDDVDCPRCKAVLVVECEDGLTDGKQVDTVCEHCNTPFEFTVGVQHYAYLEREHNRE